MKEANSTRRWISPAFVLTIACLVLSLCGAVWAANDRLIGIDDAQITFVYAEHLAHGQGFVYNVGGEHVEGATSLLWTLLCAVPSRLGIGMEAGALAMCLLLTAAANLVLLSALRLAIGIDKALIYGLIYVGLVFSSPAYVTWMTVTLMDTCLWGFLLACGAYWCFRGSIKRRAWITQAFLIVCMVLARPEAFVAAPLFILLWYRQLARVNPNPARRLLIICGTSYLCTVAGLELFRLTYFGSPLPNTFYAKVSPSFEYNLDQGWRYVAHYLTSNLVASLAGLALLLTCAIALTRVLGANRETGEVREPPAYINAFHCCTILLAVLWLLPLLTGGDHFALGRFLQPAYPIACLILTLGAHQVLHVLPVRSRFQGRALVYTGGCVAAAVWLIFFAHNPSWVSFLHGYADMSREFQIAREGIREGRHMQALFAAEPELPSVGVVTAGGFKREYRGTVIDLMGLNNSRMGHSEGSRKGYKNHSSFNKSVFFAIAPDIVGVTVNPFTDSVLAGLFDDPEFQALYTYATVSSKLTPGSAVTGFFKAELLRELASSGKFSVGAPQ